MDDIVQRLRSPCLHDAPTPTAWLLYEAAFIIEQYREDSAFDERTINSLRAERDSLVKALLLARDFVQLENHSGRQEVRHAIEKIDRALVEATTAPTYPQNSGEQIEGPPA